jgi:hypothetical protein
MADPRDPFMSFGEPPAGPAASAHALRPVPRREADWTSPAITALAVLFLATAAYALIQHSKVISLGYLDINSTSAAATLEIVYVGVGVGLLARRELMRELCILLAMVGVVAALYGTFRYVRQININQPAAVLATTREQDRVTSLQTAIAKETAQNNAALSAQGNAELATLQADLAVAQAQVVTDTSRERWNFSGLILAGVLAIVSLLLLTRPLVRARFS